MRTEQDDLAAYIGLDWGDQHHAVQLQAVAGGPVERLKLEQRPDVLHAWAAQLRQRFGGRPVGIAIEQCKGAVIHALMQYEFLVLYPVNPKALARYREVFAPSGRRTTPPMRPCCSTWSGPTGRSSGPGSRRPSRPASSTCSANIAANWSTGVGR